jgi:NAD(P)-dependent dehydrogenase (short-subunit alcohol dehydrogenase family)
MMDLQLEGKRALVTGNSGGISESIAKALAAEGVAVVVHGRREAEARRVAGEIAGAGGRASVALGDLARDEGAAVAAESALAAFGGIDILVNNAGAFPCLGWSDCKPEEWTALYDANVTSVVRVIHRLLPQMKALGWGRVINIASRAGPQPDPGMAVYSITKAANIRLTVSLAREVAGAGITVNTVSPGPVVTGGFKEWFPAIAVQHGWDTGDDRSRIEAHVAEHVKPLPAGRLGQPEDIARMVAYLASPLAGFVTGANIRVDGGSVSSMN